MEFLYVMIAAIGLMVAEPEPEKSAEAVVQAQLDAYNDADIERFISTFSEDMVALNYPGKELFRGHAGLRKGYADFFKRRPDHEVFIETRVVQGNKVIDIELYSPTGKREDIRPGKAIAIYTVENGKITRMEFVQPK